MNDRGELSETGLAVQAYLRAKWKPKQRDREASEILVRLGRELQLRLDALGFDGEQLLSVEATQVLRRLKELEYEAMLEDARVNVGSNKGSRQACSPNPEADRLMDRLMVRRHQYRSKVVHGLGPHG
jgi:hypothetical protein